MSTTALPSTGAEDVAWDLSDALTLNVRMASRDSDRRRYGFVDREYYPPN